MIELNYYLQDGADYQSRAVLMIIQYYIDTDSKVSRWENCREQGYIISSINKKGNQLNIAFFQHRNSDQMCAIKWEQLSLNSINIDTAVFGDIYKHKYDVSYSVEYGEIVKMAKWIAKEFNKYLYK